jgi:hypothetical protein
VRAEGISEREEDFSHALASSRIILVFVSSVVACGWVKQKKKKKKKRRQLLELAIRCVTLIFARKILRESKVMRLFFMPFLSLSCDFQIRAADSTTTLSVIGKLCTHIVLLTTFHGNNCARILFSLIPAYLIFFQV